MASRTTFLSPHRAPERYNITDFHLPALVYRACLPSGPTGPSVSSFLEPNRWIRGADSNVTVAHQCLAVLKGHNRLILGKGPFQSSYGGNVTAGMGGVVLDLYERDILVLPAGVLHHSISSLGNYEHIVFYPMDSPHFRQTRIEENQATTSLPDEDPIFGFHGPLVGIWKESEEAWLKLNGA